MPPIHIHWDSDQRRSVVAEFNEPWTWEEFHQTVQSVHRLVASVPYEVDVIVWHKVQLPPGNPITHLSQTVRHQPPNLRRTIIVSPPMSQPLANFLKTIAALVQRAYPNRKPIITASSIEEAWAIVSQSAAGKSG